MTLLSVTALGDQLDSMPSSGGLFVRVNFIITCILMVTCFARILFLRLANGKARSAA
jgi:hypothetical protein